MMNYLMVVIQSIEEFKDRETLPHRYRIKRSRFIENYPSLFDYVNEIPKHHTVDRLVADEQEGIKQKDSQTKARNQN